MFLNKQGSKREPNLFGKKTISIDEYYQFAINFWIKSMEILLNTKLLMQ